MFQFANFFKSMSAECQTSRYLYRVNKGRLDAVATEVFSGDGIVALFKFIYKMS